MHRVLRTRWLSQAFLGLKHMHRLGTKNPLSGVFGTAERSQYIVEGHAVAKRRYMGSCVWKFFVTWGRS